MFINVIQVSGHKMAHCDRHSFHNTKSVHLRSYLNQLVDHVHRGALMSPVGITAFDDLAVHFTEYDVDAAQNGDNISYLVTATH